MGILSFISLKCALRKSPTCAEIVARLALQELQLQEATHALGVQQQEGGLN